MNSWKSSSTGSKRGPWLLGAAIFLAAAALLNICLGASRITLPQLWRALLSGPDQTAAARILWYVRLPRTAASLLAGSGLAVSGAVIQKVLANNLASPGIIGINAGAGLAVAACCAFGTYAAAGLQNVITGLLLDNNTVNGVHDFTYVSWFWLGSAVISFLLPVLNWRRKQQVI